MSSLNIHTLRLGEICIYLALTMKLKRIGNSGKRGKAPHQPELQDKGKSIQSFRGDQFPNVNEIIIRSSSKDFVKTWPKKKHW
jgi:hypothetical protein